MVIHEFRCLAVGEPLAELSQGPEPEEPGIKRHLAHTVDCCGRVLASESDESLKYSYALDTSLLEHGPSPSAGLRSYPLSLGHEIVATALYG